MMVYIMCPTDFATGGTELLHQLNIELINQGCDSSMVFIGEYENSPVQKKFKQYQIKIASKIEDLDSNWIIVPEACPERAIKYKKAKKCLWWLSVDNYYGISTPEKPNDLLRRTKRELYNQYIKCHDRNWVHLVQCQYARYYVNKIHQIPEAQILSLSDYLSIEHTNRNAKIIERDDIILYNPKKGYEFVTSLITYMGDKYQWIALQNMTSDEIHQTMSKAKVYIDFGHHPGKDRMPREAALAGCCVITGKRGSAGFEEDVPIPNEAKFNQTENDLQPISDYITKCIINYSEMVKQYDKYITKILNEEAVFKREVGDFITYMRKRNNSIT